MAMSQFVLVVDMELLMTSLLTYYIIFFYDLCDKYMTFMFYDNLTLNYGNVTVCLRCKSGTCYDVFLNLFTEHA